MELKEEKLREFTLLTDNLIPNYSSLEEQVEQNIDTAIAKYRGLCDLDALIIQQETEAMDEYFKATINIMKLILNIGVDYGNITTQISNFKDYLNAYEFKKDLPYEDLAKSTIFGFFPTPTSEEIGYQKFYNTIQTIRLNSLLAHRFEINGKLKAGTVEYNLHEGFPETMVSEINQSFASLLKINKDKILACLASSEFNLLGENKLINILNEVSQDLSNCVFYRNDELISALAEPDQILLTTPSIYTSAGKHAISVAFYNNLCLISDKSNENPGAHLFVLEGTSEEIKENKIKIALDLMSPGLVNDDTLKVTTEIITENMTKVLQMKKIASIPLQTQYGDNCSWSSSAKSVLLSALFFKLHIAAKNLDSLKSLTKEEYEIKAIELACFYSKKIRNLWSHYDQQQALKSYIEEAPEPSSTLLACIQLKNPNNKELNQIIKESKLVTQLDLLKARAMADENLKDILQNELGKDNYNSISASFPDLLQEIITKLRDLCILTRKSNTKRVFSSIDIVNDENSLKNSIHILNEELSLAISAKHPKMFFNQNQNFELCTKKDSDSSFLVSNDLKSLNCFK